MVKIRKSLPEFEVEMEEGGSVSVFKLRQLSELELEEVNYILIDMVKGGHQVLPPKAIKLCLEKCLISWSGVLDESGGEMRYIKGHEQYLPAKVRMALASEIYVRSVMTEEEKKS